MFKTVVITALVLCIPVAVCSAVSLWNFFSWIANFLQVFPKFDGIERASLSALSGYLDLIGYVSLWRFCLRLSPRFEARSDAETNSITIGIISGMLGCIPLMFQFFAVVLFGMPFLTPPENNIGWVFLSPVALGIASLVLFTTDLFALMEMA
jgi:hypothetical protein